MIDKTIDVHAIFTEVQKGYDVQFRDPMLAPYGDETKMTVTQKKAWQFFWDWWQFQGNMMIALIGAKGSAKTHFGACYAMAMAQLFPGSLGCLISNSYPQAKDNAGPILIKVAKSLGYDIEFFTTKKIRGRPFTNVFVIKLTPEIESFILVRSFDAIEKLEGVELDYGWGEEVQDADPLAFTIFVSRIRGQNANKSLFVAAMPEDETHWQYRMLPKIGMVEAEKFTGPVEVMLPDGSKVKRVGIMYEPNVFENVANVGGEYIERLMSIYSPEMAERYVFGRRGSVRGDRVFYRYRSHIHRGRMSEYLCHYNPYDDLILSYDFNVYPMSAAAFQPKMWNDKWLDLFPREDGAGFFNPETGKVYSSLEDYAAPDRKVWAQVNEWEVYPDDPDGGMTRGMTIKIEREYRDIHMGRLIVLGDASGNQRRSSSDTTDWQIIGESVRSFREPYIIRGLISNMDVRAGVTRYSNPSQRDALQNANRVLMDANEKVWICFLPTSIYPSGGLAASVSSLGFKADGSFETKSEKKMDRDVTRSHFGDVFKYFCWYAMPPGTASGRLPSDMTKKESTADRIRHDREKSERLSGWV